MSLLEIESGQGTIDWSKPFFPAALTPMAQTPSWRGLPASAQLRYTQLFGLYANEQTRFFEEALCNTVLPALMAKPDRIGPELAGKLQDFRQEELQHSRWFRELNHRVDPQLYPLTPGSYRFIRTGAVARTVLHFTSSRPFRFPFWIWLMLLMEERSIHLSRECLKKGVELEPSFAGLHRRHLADEIGHVRLDQQLVEAVWLPMPMRARRLQASLFLWLVREFFSLPKRTAYAVLRTLVEDCPEIAPLEAQLKRELAELGNSLHYHSTMYDRTITPGTFRWFDQLPEFHDAQRAFHSYRRADASGG